MHQIGFIVFPGFQMLSLAPLTAFEVANYTASSASYAIRLLSERGGLVECTFGATVQTEMIGDAEFDTIMVGGRMVFGELELPPSSPSLIRLVQKAAKVSRRTAAICSGAFILADAGLLDGRRATTHWYHARNFQSRYPNVRMEEDRIYINDGPIWTSAGMTAGMDLALAMIERDLGQDRAKATAKLLVMEERRMGGRRQQSGLLDIVPKTDRIGMVLAHIRANLRDSLSIAELSQVAKLSPRQFSRAFQAETGLTPGKAVERLRLEAARFMMEEERHTVNAIAEETGFLDRERMRRAFIRVYGDPPQTMRRNARADAA